MAKRRINEFRLRPPTAREVAAARKLAKRVSKRLLELMEAKGE